MAQIKPGIYITHNGKTISYQDYLDSLPKLDEVVPKHPLPKDGYRSTHAVWVGEDELGKRSCWAVLPVCESIWRTKWDIVALAYVLAVTKPTAIRVTTGEIKTDAMTGRVTIFVDANDTIMQIEQELRISVPESIQDGFHFKSLVAAKIKQEKPP